MVKEEKEIGIVSEWYVGTVECPRCKKKLKIIHRDAKNFKPRKNFRWHTLEELPF